MSDDRNIEHLRFLTNFYTSQIETRQIQMNIAEREFLKDRSNIKSYDEWTGNKLKICDLYECWLRELNNCQVATYDDMARIMHSMMTSDCYWFLAKMNKKAPDQQLSNYALACESLESIFAILNEALTPTNPFYQHVMTKYEQLVEDYRKTIGEATMSGASTHVPAGMTSFDIKKCREAMKTVQNLRNLREKKAKCNTTTKALSSQIYHLSRIMLNTLV